MTITEIIVRIAPYKPISKETLYKHLRELKIKPIGARQSPQRYPDDSADLVLKRLGFKPKKNNQRHGAKLLAA